MAPGLIDYRDPPPNYLRNAAQPCMHRTPLNLLRSQLAPQLGPKLAQIGPSWLNLAQLGPQLGSKFAQVVPSWHNLAPTWPCLALSWPLMAPFLGTSWPQNGPKFVILQVRLPLFCNFAYMPKTLKNICFLMILRFPALKMRLLGTRFTNFGVNLGQLKLLEAILKPTWTNFGQHTANLEPT